MIEYMKITFKRGKCETHQSLNEESFWEFIGDKNASLIEIGVHIQYYEKIY